MKFLTLGNGFAVNAAMIATLIYEDDSHHQLPTVDQDYFDENQLIGEPGTTRVVLTTGQAYWTDRTISSIREELA